MLVGIKVVVTALTIRGYGLRGGELYQVAQGKRLQWGYLDNGPVVPALVRLGGDVFGRNAVGLRIVPAVLGVGLILLGALLARELGGGRWAQTATACVALVGTVFVGASGELGPVVLELVAWSAATLVLMRLLRTGDQRLWVAVGFTVGLGVLSKQTMLAWVVGMSIGLLASRYRPMLFSWWAVAGIAVGLLVWSPLLLWMASDGWQTLEFVRDKGTQRPAPIEFLITPLFMATIGGSLFWIRPIIGRWTDDRVRVLAMCWWVLLVLFVVAAGKPYYLAGMLLPLVAAGAVRAEQTASARGRRGLLASVVVSGVLLLPLSLPVLPSQVVTSDGFQFDLIRLQEMVGYHGLAQQVGDVYRSIPEPDRRRTTIVGHDYGTTGAIEFWRQEYQLPQPVSGANSYWAWGYGGADDDGPVILVGFEPGAARQWFEGCEEVARLGEDHDLDGVQAGRPILVCERPAMPWSALWPDFLSYAE